jgi:hypothetical protein
MDKELRNRIILANKRYHGLNGKFKSHFLTLNTKLRSHKTLVRPVLIYASESWTLIRGNEEGLRIFERKLLRRIFGPVCENGFWNIRYNNEFCELFSELDIVKTIKIGRSEWEGHIIQMLGDNHVKKLTLLKPNGCRRAERPKLR